LASKVSDLLVHRRMIGGRRALVALLLAAGAAAAGCRESRLPPGRTLVVGLESNPTHLDPRFSQDAVSSQVQRMIFSRLLTRDAEGRIVPELAEAWERPSPLVHRLRLRAGVRFHDGAPLTSEDVKYTFDSVRAPGAASPRAAGLKELDRVETPSSREVVFRLREPSAAFAESLMMEIVPRSAAAAGPRFAARPVGTGPFRFVRFEPDERVELAAFADHFAGRPALDRLVFRILPEETIRVLELESGGIHLIQNAFSPDLLPRLAAHPRLRILRRAGTNFTYLGFNLADPILSRPKVRRAIGLESADDTRHWLEETRFSLDHLKSACGLLVLQEKVWRSIPEADIEAYYNGHTEDFARVDLYGCRVKNRKQADDIADRVRGGASFHLEAIAHSIDAETAPKGGYIGRVSRNEVPEEIRVSVFSVDPGDVIGPIKLREGFAIFTVTGVFRPSLDDLGEDIRNLLFDQLVERLVDAAVVSYPVLTGDDG